MFLVAPHGEKRKWDIRLRNHGGRVVKIPGDRERSAAQRIGDRVEMLVKAKANGDPPPAELASWIANRDAGLAERLVDLGLVPLRQLHRHKPLIEWVDDWANVVRNRKPNSSRHAPQQGSKVRRIVTALSAKALSDLDADRVTETINGFTTAGCKNATPLATVSRRGYGIAIGDFAEWLAKKLHVENPLKDMEVPGQYEAPEYERQPLTVAQFQRLLKFLDSFERYDGQHAQWTAYDRKLIYWTAVKTGYRQGELRALRRANLYLGETPAIVSLKARHTKNKTDGEVPIPSDLAKALKK